MKSINILIFILTSLALLNNSTVLCVTFKCEFKIYTWPVGRIYTCIVLDNGIFENSRVFIDSIEGQHIAGYSNEDVHGIWIKSIANLNFFPSNMDEFFENLNAINIYGSQLQEISQSDLRAFPDLNYIGLGDNKIKFIEKDTFKYNQKLKGIWLHRNQISHIDKNAFSELKQLDILHFSDNKCKKSISNANTKSDVLNRIKRIEDGDCFDADRVVPKIVKSESIIMPSRVNVKVDNKLMKNLHEILEINDEANKKMIVEIEEKFTTMMNEMDQKHEEMSRKIENLVTENQQLKSEVIALKSQDEKLISDVQKLLNDKNQMNEQIRALTDENKQLKQEIEHLKQADDQFKDETQIVTNNLADVTLKNDKTMKNVEFFQSTIKIMKDHFVEISSYNTLYNQLMKSNRELTAEYKTITDEIKILTSDNVNIKFDIAVLEAYIKDIQKKHIKVAEEVNQMNGRYIPQIRKDTRAAQRGKVDICPVVRLPRREIHGP